MGQPGVSCLGRVTPDGIVSEVAVPTLNAKLSGITTDADGNLWFTEFAVNKIGELRFTSSPQP
jgi:virginiamycin B lyase